MTEDTAIQIGKLPPRHTFFLNPYEDERYTRCPECEAPTKVRKKPFLIHIDPDVLLLLNMRGRYCPACDVLILHQNVVEDLLVRTFEPRRPEIIGNDYLILGTVEPAFWRKHKGEATAGPTSDHLHDFARVVIYGPMRPRWMPPDG
ncbi:MAG: hypothetical protein P8189_25945 [Anaerolineae bacterium]